jgi:hypothetical protein
MSFNHIYLLQDIDYRYHKRHAPPRPVPRTRLNSDCCLPKSLPSLKVLEHRAKEELPRAEVKLLRHQSTSSGDSSSNSSSDAPTSPSQPRPGGDSKKPQAHVQPIRPRGWKEPEHWEVVQAIEKKDFMRLSEIRDHSFHVRPYLVPHILN